MDASILIPISMFTAIFGIVYLYLSTRNKERLALIEKGADAAYFSQKWQFFSEDYYFKSGTFVYGYRNRCFYCTIINDLHNIR